MRSNRHPIAKLMIALLAAGPLSASVAAIEFTELDVFEQFSPTEPRLLPPVQPAAHQEAVNAELVQTTSLADKDPLQRPIFSLTADGAAPTDLVLQLSKLPADFAINDSSRDRFGSWDQPEQTAEQFPPRFTGTMFTWAAPAVFHRPLLFEQPNLERYGHYVRLGKRDNLTQSAISAAHFFATVPVVPYKVGATGGLFDCNDNCPRDYVLGSYRPGSCNPHQLIKPKWSWRGLAYQGAATTGLVFLLP